MKQDKKCSRCGHICIADKLQIERMKRHVAGRHTIHKTISERDGSIITKGGIGNLDIGKVIWITLW